ncbi:MAG: ABC transporter substrate-binding protein [Bacilli bacterium]|nr:ABC transporter substrate-binding protein [Bacilli bacterium]
MRKFIKLLCFAPLMCAGLTGCDSGKKIGILQPLEHAALSEAREGFMEAVNAAGLGYKFKYVNANESEADLNSGAKTLVSTCELTLGIGTGAAQSLQAAAVNSGSTKPILFTAVTDPVGAKLVASNEKPGGHITGASDMNPVAEQVAMIKEVLPTVSKVGIFYTASETNSEVQANQAEAALKAAGLEVIRTTCTNKSDLAANINALCAQLQNQAIYIPTDNTVAGNMPTVKAALEANHVLAVCGEDNMMAHGGHLTLTVSYKELGKRTGEMAVEILKNGKSPADLPVVSMTAKECVYKKCSENITAAGLSLDSDALAKFTDMPAA